MTEALAATLEAAPAAAKHLVGEWFALHAQGDLTVTTQRWVGAGERLDLELVFGSIHRPDVRVWLESKVGATPWRDQAERYRDVLDLLHGKSRLTWLLPLDKEVKGGSPKGVDEHTWQDLAVALNNWRTTLDDTQRCTYAARLVGEFVNHLEEEGLAVTQPLSEQDIAAVEGYEMAAKRVGEIIRLAGARIHAVRPRLDGGPRPPDKIGFWEHVGHSPSWPTTAFFEWRGTHDGLRRDPTGSLAIGAGISWEQGNEPSERVYPEWFEGRYAEAFEYGVSRHKMVYLLRYQTLPDLVASAELLGKPELSGQAEVLADWALESWALLEQAPLPVPE